MSDFNDSIQKVFLISLNQKTEGDYVFLKNYAQDLVAEGKDIKFCLENLEEIIHQRLLDEKENEKISILQYLIDCWKRVETFSLPEDIKSRMRYLCVSYAGMSIQISDLFPQPSYSMSEIFLSSNFPQEFITSMIRRFTEDNSIDEIFIPILLDMAKKMKNETILTNFIPLTNLLLSLVQFPEISKAICAHDISLCENSMTTARQLEENTILGPFFRLTTFGTDDLQFALSQFGNENLSSRANVLSAFTAHRLSLKTLRQSLFEITKAIIKTSVDCRNSMLQFWATILNINHDRGKMHIADPNLVSSDGFMMNNYIVLLKFCEPFLDASFSKLHLIDPEYFSKSKRINVEKSTKLNAVSEEEKDYFSAVNPSESHFVTEIFFLTISFHHLSLHKIYRNEAELKREITELKKQVDHMKASENIWMAGPRNFLNKEMLKRIEAHLSKIRAILLSFEIQLSDTDILSRVIDFIRLLMRFLLKTATTPSVSKSLMSQNSSLSPDYGKGINFNLSVPLPLPQGPSIYFRMFPEFYFENIPEFVRTIMYFHPTLLANSPFLDELVSFSIVFLASSNGSNTQMLQTYTEKTEEEKIVSQSAFVRNPYLIAKFVECFYSLTWDFGYFYF
jgi:ubiquitin conjugation factor E4 B